MRLKRRVLAGEGLLRVDLDGDDDQDIIINGTWYENVGQRRWTAHTFARPQDWSHPNTFIAAADLNRDGRLDLVLAPSELKGGHYRIVWFEAPSDPRQEGWPVQVVVPGLETVCHFIGAADFDGDGRVDLACAQMPQGVDPDLVQILFNRGTPGAPGWIDSWQPLTISEAGSHSMRILDADGDGRPDLVGANWSAEGQDEDVKLWLNRLRPATDQPLIHVWQRWESVLTSSHTYSNPYADVTLRVTYTGPEGRTIQTYGFWDGGDTFRLRCAFPAAGVWEWRTECSDSGNAGLQRQSGKVNVLPYTGDNPLYRHGFLKVSDNRRYLVLGDGTPFLWLGDTAWAAPMRASDEEWEEYLDDRVSKHFTLLQVAPAPHWAGTSDRQGQEPFIGKACAQWNPAYWQSFERKIQRANESGLAVLLVGLMEPVSRYPESSEACLFARNIVARLFGNFAIFSPSFDSEVLPLANQVGRVIRDATRIHLVTQHPGTPWNQPLPTFSGQYYDEPYLDFVGVQTGHNGGHLDWCAHHAMEWNLHLYRHEPHKPVVNLEAMYDARGSNAWRAVDARSLGWRTWLSGAAGYTYGAGDVPPKIPQGSGAIWKWVTDPETYDYWRKALQWESAFQMRHLHDFLASIDWWRLEPAHELIHNQTEDVIGRAVLARSAPGDLAVAYLPAGNAISIDLSSFPAPLHGRWFDPVHGGFTPITGPIENKNKDSRFTPPSEGDWVLLLEKGQ